VDVLSTKYLAINDGNKNVNAFVGEYIDLQAVVKPDGMAGDYQWDTPPGVIFKSYSMDVNTATLTTLAAGDLKSSTLQFYWTDAGAKPRNVRCVFTPKNSGKGMANPDTTLNIKSPNVSTYTYTIGKAGYFTDANKKLWFGLYDADGAGTGEPGIDFTAAVDSIKADFLDEGSFAFVQRVWSDKTAVRQNGDTYAYMYPDPDDPNEWIYATAWRCDTDVNLTFPYAGPYSTGSGKKYTEDSPADTLTSTITKSLTVGNVKFDMYLMFLPRRAGGKSAWVPLQVINWSYKGTSTWNVDTSQYDPTGLSQTPAANGAGVPTTTHPEWRANGQSAEWIKTN
jgi:hypothetical protein